MAAADAGSPAASSFAAATAPAARWRRAATRASSSSTRRPRSRPDTGPAPSAGTPTTSSFLALTGAAARRARRRSTNGSTRSAGRRTARAALRRSFPTVRFVLLDDEPWLVLGAELLRWTAGGYTERRARPRGRAVRDHAADDPGRPRRRLGRERAAPPSVERHCNLDRYLLAGITAPMIQNSGMKNPMMNITQWPLRRQVIPRTMSKSTR